MIGLTGGIGTGKSRVLDTLVSLGADGVDADHISREVMLPGGPAFEPVVAAFGRDILTTEGQIDRSRLGQRVFADPVVLRQLESIVHPAVHEAIKGRLAASEASVFVIEAIKLLEAGLSRALCDVVWVTHCSYRSQVARLKASRGMSEAEVRRRLANQMPPAEMARQADRVINTDGSYAETDLAVLAGWAGLAAPLPPPEYAAATDEDAEGVAAVLNSVVREGGQTVIDRTFTPVQERRFIRSLPPRSRLTVARLGRVIAGFQVMEPYADYTGAMDHVAGLGTYVAAPVRGRGLGQGLMEQTCAAARQMGYRKFVIMVRADNARAQAFYERLGFRACGRLTGQARLDGREVDEIIYEYFLQ